MRNNWWKLEILVGLVFVLVIGGGRLSAVAAGDKADKEGKGTASASSGEIKTARNIPIDIKLKVTAGTGGGTQAAEGRINGDGIKHIGNEESEGMEGDAAKTENPEGEQETGVAGGDALKEDGSGADAQRMEDGMGSSVEEGISGEQPEENGEEIDAYFDGSVFVGDSIMLGFRNYAMKRQDSFLSRMNFLAAGSFSANNALWEVGGESVHPVYQGEQRQVWESIALMGSKKVFLMLGMNDLNITGVEGTCEIYKELIGKILEKDPEAEIHLMSMTYVLKGKEAGKLNNETIREYNGMLEEMAEENGWGFVNVAEALADGNGDLAEEYCSDGFAHQNPEAYDVWVSVLREYAGEHL